MSRPGSGARRAFVVGAILATLALAWVTTLLLDLERRERAARRSAELEERIGQALSRLDWALAPVLAAEAARWTASAGESQVPTILPGAPFVRSYFEILRSGGVQPELQELAGLRDRVLGPPHQNAPFGSVDSQPWAMNADREAARSQLLQNIGNQAFLSQQAQTGTAAETAAFEASFLERGGAEPTLVFLRQLSRSRRAVAHGAVADWPKLRDWLREQVSDLFDAYDLVPDAATGTKHRMAWLPVRLHVTAFTPVGSASASPVTLTLVVVWVAFAIALLVAGLSLRSMLDLSARRALFVSAVTHELRTPLTTFRMYSEMLADGMVREPAARQEYLEVLRRESQRLARIVESVLLYARLEEGDRSAHRTLVEVDALLARVREPLVARAQETGRSLRTELVAAPGLSVLVDPQAVEQILLNLLDNALKYAPSGELELRAEVRDHTLVVTFTDQGPGIPEGEREAIFAPFTRGDAQRSGTVPGLGLGLALARGLARAFGGDLVLLDGSGPGASFALRLAIR